MLSLLHLVSGALGYGTIVVIVAAALVAHFLTPKQVGAVVWAVAVTVLAAAFLTQRHAADMARAQLREAEHNYQLYVAQSQVEAQAQKSRLRDEMDEVIDEVTRDAVLHIEEAQARERAAHDARDATVVAADRLRQQLAAAKRAGSSQPAATAVTGAGERDSAALDLLTGLLSGHTAELVEVGAYADQLRGAGARCEQVYDSARRTLNGGEK